MTTHSVADRSGFVHELLLPPRPPRWLSWSSHSPGMVWQPRNRRCSPSGPRSPQLSATPWSQHRTSRSCPAGQPGRPASDLRAQTPCSPATWRRHRVRILNQEPTVPGSHWHEWRRLEAVVNLALAHHDACGPYASTTGTRSPPTRLTTCATHPLLWSEGQHCPNDGYQDPVKFIRKHSDAPLTRWSTRPRWWN